MNRNKSVDRFFSGIPVLVFSLILFLLVFLREVTGLVLPAWGAWGFGVLWGFAAFGYVAQLGLLKRIGGIPVFVVAALILFGSLASKDWVGHYPDYASVSLVSQMESTWNAVYSGDFFKSICFKESILDWGRSLAGLDPFQTGQIVLFVIFAIVLGFCFLFPSNVANKRSYFRRWISVFLCGFLFGMQMELLQVLTRTREVTFFSIFESATGLFIGLVLFSIFQILYSRRADRLERDGWRFNVLGVGVDAVNIDDCIRLFEKIIKSAECRMQHDYSADSEVNSTKDEYAGNLKCETGNLKLENGEVFTTESTEDHRGGEIQESNVKCVNDPQINQINTDLCDENNSGFKFQLSSFNNSALMTSALGVAGIVEARRNPRLQRILNESVLNTPDGMPLVWLGKLFGYKNIARVYGPDLLRDVCAYGADKGWKHYFYGAAPGIVEKLKEKLEAKHPSIDIVGIYCPPFRPLTEEEESALIAEVAEKKPDVFWVGISTPKQLYFMDQMKDKLDCKIICPVGYAFDVNAGVEQDAPDWIKYSGFQWLHRAIKQPRLWKRYLPDNPRFMFEVFLQIFHLRSYPMYKHERPMKPFKDAEGYDRYPVGVTSVSAMTLQSAVERVAGWIKKDAHHYVNVCTADTMVHCNDNPEMAKIVSNSGMATTDGMPLMIQGKWRGFDVTRVYGPDLMLELCRYGESRGFKHYFYGATDEVLAKLKTNLLAQFPDLQIAGMYSPPFRPLTEQEESDIAEMINAAEPHIVWCGLGTPKQDFWVAKFQPKLNANALLAVGAAFNFHAGEVKQAPRWMMKCSLEWLFRLWVEPKRLWKRYLIGNPRFVLICLRQRWGEIRYAKKYAGK